MKPVPQWYEQAKLTTAGDHIGILQEDIGAAYALVAEAGDRLAVLVTSLAENAATARAIEVELQGRIGRYDIKSLEAQSQHEDALQSAEVLEGAVNDAEEALHSVTKERAEGEWMHGGVLMEEEKRNAQASQTSEATISGHQKTIFQLQAAIRTTDVAEEDAKKAYYDVLVELSSHLAALHAEARLLDNAQGDLICNRETLHLEHAQLLDEASRLNDPLSKATDDDTIFHALLLMNASEYNSNIAENSAALEQDIAEYDTALKETFEQYTSLLESLEFSTVEHRLHMELCTNHREPTVSQTQFLEKWVSDNQVAVDALGEEAASLSIEMFGKRTQYEEELQGLSWRLSQVSQGYAGEETRLAKITENLEELDTQRKKESHIHRLAVKSYQLNQRMEASHTESLEETISEQDVWIAEGESWYGNFGGDSTTLYDSHRKLDAVTTDLSDIAQEMAAKDAEIEQLTGEVAEAERTTHSFHCEVAGQQAVFDQKIAEITERNNTFRQRIVTEEKIHRAVYVSIRDRSNLAEAAIQILSPMKNMRVDKTGLATSTSEDNRAGNRTR